MYYIMLALDLSDRTVINYFKLVHKYEGEEERETGKTGCSSNIHTSLEKLIAR